MKKIERKPDFWAKILYFILAVGIKIAGFVLFGLKIHSDDRVRQWKRSKEPLVILCTHPSEIDAIGLLSACFPRYARFVVGAQQLYKGTKGKLLRDIGVISKKQFVPDIVAIKEMMHTINSGMILGMMPEGRVSMDGTANPIEFSTAKLLKKLGANVAILHSTGSYFIKPPYNYHGIIRGKLSGELKPLISKEELGEMSEEEIFARITNGCIYHSSEELRGSKKTYKKRNEAPMKGVSKLFYRCPSCGRLYTVKDEDGKIFCTECAMTLWATPEMFFTSPSGDMTLPDTIEKWNKQQLEFEHEFWSKEDAKLVFSVRKEIMNIGVDENYRELGYGTLSLSASGMDYEGPDESLHVDLSRIPGMSSDYEDGYIIFYQGNFIRRFFMEDDRYAARFINSLMVLKKCA